MPIDSKIALRSIHVVGALEYLAFCSIFRLCSSCFLAYSQFWSADDIMGYLGEL